MDRALSIEATFTDRTETCRMQRKLFGAIAALLVLSVVTLYAGSINAEPQRWQINQTPKNVMLVPILSVDESNTVKEENKPCEAGNDNRASDLCAQWKAADAAAQAAFWTGFSVLIATATLAAAVAAAYFASKAAHVANGAYSVQIEPFVTVYFGKKSNTEISKCGNRSQPVDGAEELWFTLKNPGLSPIVVTQICRRWDFSGPEEAPRANRIWQSRRRPNNQKLQYLYWPKPRIKPNKDALQGVAATGICAKQKGIFSRLDCICRSKTQEVCGWVLRHHCRWPISSYSA